jgi:hypothetical protein
MRPAVYEKLIIGQEVLIDASKTQLEKIGIDDDINGFYARISGFYKTRYVEIKISERTYDIPVEYLMTKKNQHE